MKRIETRLTEAAKLALKKNLKLRRAVLDRWDCNEYLTLKRWMIRNDYRLTHPDTIALICAYEKCEPAGLTETFTIDTENQTAA